MVEVPKLTVSEWGNILSEIQFQPPFRRVADEESDYFDGNQLDSQTLRDMKDLGMAPCIENLIAPTIDSITGREAQNRLDFRVTAETDGTPNELAEAMNEKLNEAERNSKADQACTEAFAGQVKVGLSWVEVGFESDPFKYEHKVESVHRNSIFWDFKAKSDMSDARFLVRKGWYDAELLQLAFPEKAETLKYTGGGGWLTTDLDLFMDGGKSTDLSQGFEHERAWTVAEQEWRDMYRRRLCLSEVWYRRWVRGMILRTPDGRVIEYDEKNPDHLAAVQSGAIEPTEHVYSKVRMSWWVGPHNLGDIENPYKHGKIPYIPFFGSREDMTGIPYGKIRAMRPLQDEINARSTKSIWLLSAKSVTMTAGAADVNTVRLEAARANAVHVLDPAVMGRPGAVFKIESDLGLNAQQHQTLIDKREQLKNVAGVYAAFEGQNSNAKSGIALNTLVDQSSQTLANIYDNNKSSRIAVGQLLLSNVIQVMGKKQTDVKLNGLMKKDKRVVSINMPTAEGMTNDIQRALLKVSLGDVPTTTSYKRQQSAAFGEIVKSLVPEMQAQLMDFYLLGTDMPYKEEAVERIRKIIGVGEEQQQPDPQMMEMQAQMQEMQKMLQDAEQQAKDDQQKLAEMNLQLRDKSAEYDLRARELDMQQQTASLPQGDGGMQAGITAKIEAEKLVNESERVATELRGKEIEKEIALAGHASAERIKQIEKDMADMQAKIDAESRVDSDRKSEEADGETEIAAIVKQVTESIAPTLKELMQEIKELREARKTMHEEKPEKEPVSKNYKIKKDPDSGEYNVTQT